MSFNELRLASPIARAVAGEGYTTPTPIQQQAIPLILAGRDVLGCAQTGTGKTAAFAMPVLHRLAESTGGNGRVRRDGKACGKPRALVLCPTRELATQIFESFKTYGKHLHLQYAAVFGGVNQTGQVRRLQRGVDVLIATPGRLLDLINQGFIDLRAVETLVLDEADRMLDMGFIGDIRKIIKLMPQARQTLLFSATLSTEIRKLADSILTDPVSVQIESKRTTVDAISQSVYLVPTRDKPALLERMLRRQGVGRTLVFTRTKYGADRLVRNLQRSGIEAGAIHGNKTQNARTRALDKFRSGGTPVLVATDVASRGIDVDEITHVVNFDMPGDPETYVHRIGRTARAGASGVALSFCDREEMGCLRSIERLIKMQLPVSGDEADLTFQAGAAAKRERSNDRQARSYRSSGAQRQRGGGGSHRGGGGGSRNGGRRPSTPSRRARS